MRLRLPYQRLAFAAAAWMRYVRGVDEQGKAYALNDPLGEFVQKIATTHQGNAAATAQALCAITSVWGPELPGIPAWVDAVTHWLTVIERDGILVALAQLNPAIPIVQA